jgi:hypothetical protein
MWFGWMIGEESADLNARCTALKEMRWAPPRNLRGVGLLAASFYLCCAI